MGDMSDEAAKPHVRLSDETIEHMSQIMTQAVKDGIRESLTPDVAAKFWEAGFTMLQKRATVSTGRFVLGGLTAAAKRLWWVVLFIAAVWIVGGWSLVLTLWKAAVARLPV